MYKYHNFQCINILCKNIKLYIKFQCINIMCKKWCYKFQTAADGHCLSASLLNQIVHHNSYTPEMAMRQAGFHMLKHPEWFYKAVEDELNQSRESYESYCFNVYHSNVWGDDLVAVVFSDMWNIAISIVSPAIKYPVDLWHNKDFPDVVLVANGRSYLSENNPTTHFSSSRVWDPDFCLPGRELVITMPGYSGDTYKKLKPAILDNKEQARKMAIDQYVNFEKEKSLQLLYGITRSIGKLDRHIAHLIHESEMKKEQRALLSHQLEVLGMSHEKIELAIHQKGLPYVLTEEAEREEVRADRKRKRAEEQEEMERQKRRKSMVIVKDGKVIHDPAQEGVEKEGEVVEIESQEKLIKQQKDIIGSQESLLLRQDNKICQLNTRIKELENKLQQQTEVEAVPQGLLPSLPSFSNITTLPELDPDAIQQWMQPVDPVASTSEARTGPFSVTNVVKAEHLKYLPKFANIAVKKEPKEAETQDIAQVTEDIEIVNLPPEGSSNIVYIPKQVGEKKALVLVPPKQKRVLNKRSNPGVPVPIDSRDPCHFYCENCSCHYKEKSDLNKHFKFNCMKTNFNYICDGCQKGFHTDYGVCEHYYQEHLKQFLYFCRLCNKGFYHKSKKSLHKKCCPSMGGEEKFEGRAPYNKELKLTFKQRQRMEVELPQAVLDLAREEQESEQAVEQLELQEQKEKEREKE